MTARRKDEPNPKYGVCRVQNRRTLHAVAMVEPEGKKNFPRNRVNSTKRFALKILTDANGDEVRLKEGAHVEVTVEAESGAATEPPKK